MDLEKHKQKGNGVVTEKQKSEMKRRKAIAKASQMVEMLVVFIVFGRQSVFFQRKGKGI